MSELISWFLVLVHIMYTVCNLYSILSIVTIEKDIFNRIHSCVKLIQINKN